MKVDKFEMYYNLMERWFTVHEEGKNISEILYNRGVSTIALYGLGKIGKHVVWELKDSKVSILYAIDRGKSGFYDSIVVKRIDEALPKVDAIIVAAIYDFEEIEKMLKNKVDYPIISLEEILYEG